MAFKVFVDGQEGTTGLRLLDYLSGRSDVELLRIAEDKRKDPAERARFLNAADVAFLCLPDVASREAVSLVTNPDTCVIDASTAFRTADNWAYGLPELVRGQREKIRASKRIAVPGCHASAFVLAVRPLVDAGVMQPDYPVTAFSLTGYSGGGKKMIADFEAGGNPKLDSPRAYALGLEHKHLPEMRVQTGLAQAPIFSPIVGKFYKGLAVTVPVFPDRLARKVTPEQVAEIYRKHYEGEQFVRVMPAASDEHLDNGFFDVQANNDTNRVDLFVFGSADRIVLIARLDNLGKGAAGAAVQCMNVHIGADEATGLTA
ncbi:N-acetyl-gamma-glutamyl-phosphate reductase [Cupriavidus gilardii]|uniref:N-acetyl-gamma-glutamyl-phosphate reductase n=1 Tax=Cupriavidus gilardii TaxID=82541 RepID=A0A6N1BI96_9BURK|nr:MULTISPECIES: N-acetyl-gamma-glutamyl-phosphate reductase [Cupriavidus]ESH97994.1 N-acetyl-gamma-glutamyl-phosphate reductase [Cupriavidus sp. HPC(L)]KAB0596692.1 N-acetyl-gamma-glutamyl-phosphate reductase [Cupriavidus gilardii]MCD9121896.1 N-acetyl-gamma-glutamyl-phosphate reductase [Cupriavidus sp. UGS-1]MCT9013657.1 N-acetyl-gamma-glutamyl-phosphate reductase [Cupriavidus gilardii]MCT9051845.1 N-acetyl-gamma-glutamyl-phosphate reductase [Cupriavidus gilardii]